MKNVFLVSALALCTSVTSVAAEGFYAGAGVASINSEEDGFEVDTVNLIATVGYEVNQTFAVEGELGLTIQEDELEVDGVDAEASLNYAAIFAKASFPLSPDFSAHGRVGFVNAEAELSGEGETFTNEESAFAFGVGGEFAISSSAAIRADATFAEIEGSDVTVLAIGSIFRF